MIIQATYNFDSPLLYAAIVMSACLSGLFFLLVVAARALDHPLAARDHALHRPRHARDRPAIHQEIAMSRIGDWIAGAGARRRAWPREADVVVVGGGPAGMAAALAAARNGASRRSLLERYNHLGGLASGGMVLVLDDMWDSHLHEISVRGICLEMIERMAALGLAEFPRAGRMGQRCPTAMQRWTRWGTFDFHSRRSRTRSASPRRSTPTAWKRASLEMVRAAGIELRLHSWFSRTLVEDGQVKGVVCDTKSGREAILGKVVIDATGDLDVAASAGAPHIGGAYIVTTVFRLGGVDTDEAERFEREQPEAFAALDREVKHLIGGSLGRTGG